MVEHPALCMEVCDVHKGTTLHYLCIVVRCVHVSLVQVSCAGACAIHLVFCCLLCLLSRLATHINASTPHLHLPPDLGGEPARVDVDDGGSSAGVGC